MSADYGHTTDDRDIRPGQLWAIEAPDSRATWRPVKVIELLTRDRALVELLNGPHKGEQIRVKIETFIQEQPRD